MGKGSTSAHRVRYALLLAMAATTLFLASAALAQRTPSAGAYPSKPVRVVVGLAPGGATDAQARILSQRLSELTGHQFIVDNRPGAGGLIGFQTVAGASPDGYTLLASSPSLTTIQAFHEKPPYDPMKDFAPIGLLTRAPYVVVTHPAFPPRTVAELIAHARAKPDAVSFGLAGIGTISHLGVAWIVNAVNLRMTLVPYKGVGPALNDLLGGQIHTTFANPTNVTAHLKSGRLRAIGVTSAERSRVFPELATVAESGIPGFDVTSWQGWLAPAATPPAIVRMLSATLAKFVNAPALAEKLSTDGGEPVGTTPEEFRRVIGTESKRWRALVKTTGIRMDQ